MSSEQPAISEKTTVKTNVRGLIALGALIVTGTGSIMTYVNSVSRRMERIEESLAAVATKQDVDAAKKESADSVLARFTAAFVTCPPQVKKETWLACPMVFPLTPIPMTVPPRRP